MLFKRLWLCGRVGRLHNRRSATAGIAARALCFLHFSQEKTRFPLRAEADFAKPNFHVAAKDSPSPAEAQILVRNEFLSVEPAMRGWIADRGNYSAPVAIGSVMRALAVGEVVESRHPDYRAGEIVTGWFGWQELATVDGGAVIRRVVETDLPHSLALGVLGLNGVTALIGLTVIGEPKPGETVLVSTAAGAVGSAVGQIAKILGCRAIGIEEQQS